MIKSKRMSNIISNRISNIIRKELGGALDLCLLNFSKDDSVSVPHFTFHSSEYQEGTI